MLVLWLVVIVVALFVGRLLAARLMPARLPLVFAPRARGGAPPGPAPRSHVARALRAPPEIFAPDGARAPAGANNCLFEAVIAAADIRSPASGEPANAELLRRACARYLASENFGDVFASGEVAGGECLWALSKLLGASFRVYRDGYGWVKAPIRHEAVPEDDAVSVCIRHVGDSEHGHWLPLAPPG